MVVSPGGTLGSFAISLVVLLLYNYIGTCSDVFADPKAITQVSVCQLTSPRPVLPRCLESDWILLGQLFGNMLAHYPRTAGLGSFSVLRFGGKATNLRKVSWSLNVVAGFHAYASLIQKAHIA